MNRKPWVSRLICMSAVAILCVLPGGCVKEKILIKVNKDGSGKIIVTKVFSRETVAGMRVQMQAIQTMHAQRMGGDDEAAQKRKDPFFDEKTLKRSAGRFGQAVSLAKARKVESGGACGYVAVYNFKDINDVFLDMQTMSREGMSSFYGGMYEMRSSSDEDEIPVAEKGTEVFEFRLTRGPSNKLQIMCPALPDASGEEAESAAVEAGAVEPGDEPDNEGDESAEIESMAMNPQAAMLYSSMPRMFVGAHNQQEVARRMMKGMRFNISVEVEGTDVKSTASHMAPGRKNLVTLVDVDADKIAASPAGLKALRDSRSMMFGGPQGFLRALTLPGVTVETNREVVVEFK